MNRPLSYSDGVSYPPADDFRCRRRHAIPLAVAPITVSNATPDGSGTGTPSKNFIAALIV